MSRATIPGLIALLLISFCLPVSAGDDWEVKSISGRKYVNVANLKPFYRFKSFSRSGKSITLENDKVEMNLKVGAQTCFMNGVKFIFSYPIIDSGGKACRKCALSVNEKLRAAFSVSTTDLVGCPTPMDVAVGPSASAMGRGWRKHRVGVIRAKMALTCRVSPGVLLLLLLLLLLLRFRGCKQSASPWHSCHDMALLS